MRPATCPEPNPYPISLLALTALWLAGCHHEAHEPQEKARFLVTSPIRRSTELTREYVAQVRAIQHIELRAFERGYLQGIFVDEGQLVQSGQRMFQITPVLYQAEVRKAEAEAERRGIEYNNTRTLADKNIVSPNELALAKANQNKAQAELALAVAHQGFAEIRAPFSGIMGRFQARKGSLVAEGDLLTTMSDNSTMWVYFNVTEAEYLKYKTEAENSATPVKLLMANGQLFDQPGHVQTIEGDFDNQTGTIAFRASFPNPRGLLRHGETGKIVMTVPLQDALLIPQKATFDVLDKKFVFVVDENNVVQSQPITVAAELPQLYVVASGLEENAKILVEGLRKVHDGSVIEPDFRQPGEVLANLEVSAE